MNKLTTPWGMMSQLLRGQRAVVQSHQDLRQLGDPRQERSKFFMYFLCTEMQLDKDGLAYTVFIVCNQGAKKVIFKACHSGTLKLAYTSPNVISTSPKNI